MKLIALFALIIAPMPCWAKLEKAESTEVKSKYVLHKATWSRDGKLIFESAIADRGPQGVITVHRYWADGQVVYITIYDGSSVNRAMMGAKGVTISEVESPLPSERGLLITSKATGYLEYFAGDRFEIPASDSELASKRELDHAISGLIDGAYEGSKAKMEQSFDTLRRKNTEEAGRSLSSEPNKAPEPTSTSVTSPAAQEPRQP